VEDLIYDLRPVTRPGQTTAYHAITAGFVVGAVVRQTTGRSLREVLASEIKAPLGLDWFDFGVDEEDAGRVAHNVETGFPLVGPLQVMMRRTLGAEWGRVLRMSNDPRFLTGVIPSGNVIVTARDVATFYQCLLDGGTVDGTRVFAPITVDRAIQAEHAAPGIDRMLGMPMRYSSGFMLGAEGVSLYGWNHPRAFGHVGLSNLFTWADPDRALVVAILTTGKPVLGPHIVALIQLISGIHEEFPVSA
jgi:CubicO group peptidase (beta-lactamase class C family)